MGGASVEGAGGACAGVCRRVACTPQHAQACYRHPLSHTHTHTPCAPSYITAIQLTAQHLLRYAVVAAVVNKRRRSVVKDLVRVVSQEVYEYTDPATEFLRKLYVEYDFEGARAALVECEQVGGGRGWGGV